MPAAPRPAMVHVDSDSPYIWRAAALVWTILVAGAAGAPPAAAAEPAIGAEPAHFHHVHLNVVDPARSIDFYRRIFGGVPLRFRYAADAVFTERSFLLFERVERPAPGAPESGIWHIGWGGVDVPREYEWLLAQGVEIHTPLYALGDGHVVYLLGPDRELIEVNTMGHHRFAHVHLLARDPDATAQWYAEHFGFRARAAAAGGSPPVGPGQAYATWQDFHANRRAWSNGFRVDNVSFVVYNLPDYSPPPPWWRAAPLYELAPQRGHAIDHFAFSYRDLDAAFARLVEAGVEIAEPISWKPALHLRSFFVAAPDGVTVEVVEERPIPEGLWDEWRPAGAPTP
ncbi:MAG TPA: VOC family protein [Thermoanaerobaculia bacterium]|nr:VOC family protein [Thermoanaerobaculia bacterium]